jgi:probable HAF family extracellular repeat protein
MHNERARAGARALIIIVLLFLTASPGFAQSTGTMTIIDLGGPGGESGAHGINARGQVVGFRDTGLSRYRAVLWEDGMMADLGSLGGDTSFGYGINNRGQVVGQSWTAVPNQQHAFRWESGR